MNVREKIEATSDGEYVICPYCGDRAGDCWEWVKQESDVRKCYECGKTYRYWAEIDVTYKAEVAND